MATENGNCSGPVGVGPKKRQNLFEKRKCEIAFLLPMTQSGSTKYFDVKKLTESNNYVITAFLLFVEMRSFLLHLPLWGL